MADTRPLIGTATSIDLALYSLPRRYRMAAVKVTTIEQQEYFFQILTKCKAHISKGPWLPFSIVLW